MIQKSRGEASSEVRDAVDQLLWRYDEALGARLQLLRRPAADHAEQELVEPLELASAQQSADPVEGRGSSFCGS